MRCIIFVHPTLSVDFWFDRARALKYQIISINTGFESTKINLSYLKNRSDFVITGSKDPAKDLAAIQHLIQQHQLNVVAIINGIDASLYYTDFLQKALLGYSQIDLQASERRLNKFKVNHQLKQQQLKIIPSVEITNKQDLIDKQSELENLGLPIIAKPSKDTAAMSAFEIVTSIEGLSNYLDQYLGKPNAYYSDNMISDIIIQKYIDLNKFGEYVLDFVSFNGKHYCRGILEYRKSKLESQYGIYRYYIPYTIDELPTIKPLIDFMHKCLTALNVQYGFTHNELFWDQKDEFYLIESNNRMAGNGIIEIYNNVYGHDPLTDYLKLANGESIPDVPTTRKSYSIALDLYNTSTDNAEKLNLDDIASFEKIIHFRIKTKNPKDFYKRYTRTTNINASILLKNTSSEQLQADIQTILQREEEGTLFLK